MALLLPVIRYTFYSPTLSLVAATSSIYRFGKTVILSKLKNSNELRQVAEQFYLSDISPEDVGQGTV